jgi:2-oxoglutarate dehydrogenase E2 component (dihydrolipoamide succinyltransferase)
LTLNESDSTMAKVDVEMPKMGESITEGTVIVWHKEPGDDIEQDETILEIGTDKVDTEVPSPAEGVLVERLVEEGDTVEVGTIIARIETEAEEAVAGASPSQPSAGAAEASPADPEPADPEPDKATADRPPTEAAGAGASADPAAQQASSSPASSSQASSSQTSSSAAGEIEVVMPKMGESITEGTIIAWFKEPGDEIDVDETILEIGTDKVDTEVPSPAAGTLKERLVEEGETVEVGTVIAVLASEDAAVAEPSAPAEPAGGAETTSQASGTGAPAPSGDGAVADAGEPAGADRRPIQRRGSDGRFYSPLVRSIATKEGLSMRELESIDGSGRDGRVTKEDVLDYLEHRDERAEPAAAPQDAPETKSAPETKGAPGTAPERPPRPSGPDTPQRASYTVEEGPSEDELQQQYGDRIDVVEMDRMRKITAEHMVRSKATSAHVTSFAEADVTGLVKFRENNKEAFQEREGIKLTYTPFFVKAAVEALREHPVLNASVEGDKIVMKKNYHVGIAVAIGQKGLLAPVIRNAGDLNIVGLARKAANMADRARNKSLQPDELQGGTFTVTNIGSLGSLMGTPIINQPQVGILATGAIQKRPVVVEDEDYGDVITVRHMMYLSLSYDHRIIDGAMGASFLRRVVDELESFSPQESLY